MDFIVGAQALREGERVITSGDGGLYPRGIPVGVARREGDGAWRVALAAAQRPIDFVRLIPFVPIERRNRQRLKVRRRRLGPHRPSPSSAVKPWRRRRLRRARRRARPPTARQPRRTQTPRNAGATNRAATGSAAARRAAGVAAAMNAFAARASRSALRVWGFALAVASVILPALPLGPLFAQPPMPLAALWAAYGWAAEDESGWRAPVTLAALAWCTISLPAARMACSPRSISRPI